MLVAGALLCASAPAAALTPTAQDRHVFVSNEYTTGSFESETLSAPDFAPFSASVDGIVFPLPGAPIAHQVSSIEPERLLASGGSEASPDSQPGIGHEINSRSVYSVDFALDAPRSFTLTGLVDYAIVWQGSCVRQAISRITLTGPSGVVAEVIARPPVPPPSCVGGCELSLPLSRAGVLAPGSYSLVARSDTRAQGVIGPHAECVGQVVARYEADLSLAPLAVPAFPLPLLPPLLVALAGVGRRMLRARPRA